MLRDGRLADVEKFDEVAGSPFAVTELIEDLTAVGLYQHIKYRHAAILSWNDADVKDDTRMENSYDGRCDRQL